MDPMKRYVEIDTAILTQTDKLSKDIRFAAKMMDKREVRFLVDTYYMMQESRIRTANQVNSMTEGGEPSSVLRWLAEQNEMMERQLKNALNQYAKHHPVGQWMLDVMGIGPVLAAGLLAYIDIEKAPTVGHIWSYAGLRPGQRRRKGEKSDWNPDLRVLCWKIGESFVKVSGREGAVYGKIYKERRAYEDAKNERGDYADQAAESLENFKFGEDTAARTCYEKGMLPPGRIFLRSKRYAVKLFLAHLHEVWYYYEYGVQPPNPYPIAHLGHAHKIPAPGGRPVPKEHEQSTT